MEPSNLGQITREVGQYLRVCLRCEPAICAPHPTLSPKWRLWPKLTPTSTIKPLIVDIFLVNYIIVWPTCIKLYLDCLWANLSGWIMRLIKIQYPFLEKIPLCRERKSCGIEHTEFIEVVNLFISSFICNLEFIS